MAGDPTQTTTSIDLTPVVTPIIQQAVSSATADLAVRIAALEQQAATAATAVITQLEPQALVAGTGLLQTVEHDPLTQRVIIWSIAGAVIVGALAILVFAMLGNDTANRWIGAAPGAAVALVLWLSNAGVVLPKPAVKEIVP